MLELRQLVKVLQASIPPSADNMARDIKSLQIQVLKLKTDYIADLADVRGSIHRKNEGVKLKEMEDRLVVRQNDVVRALTKQLADRDETVKKFRLTNHRVRNIQSLLANNLRNGTLEDSPERTFQMPMRGNSHCAPYRNSH